MSNRRLNVLTWHVHGNYLWYLSEANCNFYLPVQTQAKQPSNHSGLGHGYGGRGNTFPFGSNVIDIDVDAIGEQRFDLILFQSRRHYEVDQFQILSDQQRRLPCVYLEHDPPWEDITDQKHWFTDPNGLLVHVTHFNRLMWNSTHISSTVIEHGVRVPEDARYTGELPKGIIALNHLHQRGRKVGADLFDALAQRTPLDLVGMAAAEHGGVGEIQPTDLARFMARYRYFFSPIRYTSLGLAILEAMSVGLPIVGIAACELATVIRNGETGYLETDVNKLLQHMQRLTGNLYEAKQLGQRARALANERFSIQRFADDWQKTIWDVAGDSIARGSLVANTSSQENASCKPVSP